jgi:hypothetical protein
MDVQQSGLNFIYDLQNCSASQFDMNLSKKILKFLQVYPISCLFKSNFLLYFIQGGYPAMVKNMFIISAPKWFKIAYKVLSIFLSRKLRDRVRKHGVNINRIKKICRICLCHIIARMFFLVIHYLHTHMFSSIYPYISIQYVRSL